MKNYRDYGIETYGNKCEICGHGVVEVHHIGYQEQQEFEREVRKVAKSNNNSLLKTKLSKGKESGFMTWDGHQLGKDDRTTNLAVLCPTCHTLMHKLDVGMKILKVLPPRR